MYRQSLCLRVTPQNSVSQVLLHCRLLLLIGEHINRSQSVYDVFRLAEINLVESIADLVLHVLDHPTDVGDVRRCFAHWAILLNLKI